MATLVEELDAAADHLVYMEFHMGVHGTEEAQGLLRRAGDAIDVALELCRCGGSVAEIKAALT